MNVTKQKFEQLIRQTLDELRLTGHIVTTTDIYEDPAVLCSTVSTPNGQKHVYVDFHALTIAVLTIVTGLASREMLRQLFRGNHSRRS